MRVACLNNLYGVDILAGAAEIAKLRLFLKLIAQLDDISQVEPLPDLDFNIRTGNLLVGLADHKDATQRFGENQLPFANLNDAQIAAELAADAYTEFIEEQAADTGGQADPVAKQKLQIQINNATDLADTILYEARNEQISIEGWKLSHQPFHWFAEFPAVWQHTGFDVIIGNPPYISTKGKGKNKLNYSWLGYATQHCPNIYAACTERASNLLNHQGRLAMIVMHSLCFNDEFSKLRRFMIDKFSSLWISSYANIPDGLFSGSASVRNSILIGNRNGTNGLLLSRCRRWTAITRESLFNRVEYIQPSSTLLTACEKPRWPFIDNIDIQEAFRHLIVNNKPLSTSLISKPLDGNPALRYKNNARYIIGIAHASPPRVNSKGKIISYSYDKRLFFKTRQHRDLAQLILSGRWFYLWWLIYGSEFSVTKGVINSFPAGITDLESSAQAPHLIALATELQQELPKHLKWKANAGRANPGLKVGRYDLRECHYITDEADRLLAEAWGLTDKHFHAAGNLRNRMTFGQND